MEQNLIKTKFNNKHGILTTTEINEDFKNTVKYMPFFQHQIPNLMNRYWVVLNSWFNDNNISLNLLSDAMMIIT